MGRMHSAYCMFAVFFAWGGLVLRHAHGNWRAATFWPRMMWRQGVADRAAWWVRGLVCSRRRVRRRGRRRAWRCDARRVSTRLRHAGRDPQSDRCRCCEGHGRNRHPMRRGAYRRCTMCGVYAFVEGLGCCRAAPACRSFGKHPLHAGIQQGNVGTRGRQRHRTPHSTNREACSRAWLKDTCICCSFPHCGPGRLQPRCCRLSARPRPRRC